MFGNLKDHREAGEYDGQGLGFDVRLAWKPKVCHHQLPNTGKRHFLLALFLYLYNGENLRIYNNHQERGKRQRETERHIQKGKGREMGSLFSLFVAAKNQLFI